MKVFISWSGERSHQVAIALAKWLKLVLHFVEPFVSSDIDKGSRWGNELTGALKENQFGIVCVTPENTAKPWLLYEAGALSNAMASGRVAVLLYQCSVAALPEPLSQFQATALENKEDLQKLVTSINNAWTVPCDSETLKTLFGALHPGFWEDIKAIPAVDENMINEEVKKEDPNAQILEDILKSSRNIEAMMREQDKKTTILQEDIMALQQKVGGVLFPESEESIREMALRLIKHSYELKRLFDEADKTLRQVFGEGSESGEILRSRLRDSCARITGRGLFLPSAAPSFLTLMGNIGSTLNQLEDDGEIMHPDREMIMDSLREIKRLLFTF